MQNKLLKSARPVAKLVQGRNDWYRIEAKAQSTDTVEVYIYDEIGYWGVTAQDFVQALNAVDADQIDLHINTPGGDVFDGVAIYRALKDHKANVTTYVDSLAASAGSFIAQAGDKIIMQKFSQMMIHKAQMIVVGDDEDLDDAAALARRQNENIASIYADRAGGTVEDWLAAMKAETWYTAEEAVEAGLADEVGSTGEKADNSWDLSIFNFAGRDKAPAPTIIPAVQPEAFDAEQFRRALKEATA